MIRVYKFSSEWDKSKETYNPIFDKVSKGFDNPDIEFMGVDVEESAELASKFKIKFVPTTLIEVNSFVKFNRVGVLSESDLIAEINKVCEPKEVGEKVLSECTAN
jgi:thioredoxin-like negative regulator of GroEL